MTANPVALISTPADVFAWYRCEACGLRQEHRRALPTGGASCARCAASLNASDVFNYAALNLRLFARATDAVLVSVPLVAIVSMFVYFVSIGVAAEDLSAAERSTAIVGQSIIAAYFIFASILCASAGTRGAGIRIVDARTWRRPSLARGAARTLAIALTIATLGIGYFAMLWDDERRTLHDRIAGTRVIER